ncbi:MAG: HD domain-containing protein [Bacilli bacterium]|nr:HD domain-containing protein [Bacilli bacterium]
MKELDREYNKIVYHILVNEEFNKIKSIEHHGVTRYDHSLKVSYYSYKIAKFLHLDYRDVARGGLLHDFFLSNEERTSKERFLSTFIHPKRAVEKSLENFELTEKEIDMIRTHMFPINIAIPKYAESWVVSFVDKGVAMIEFEKKFQVRLAYLFNVYFLLLLNHMR